jgi:hypothetical protein
MTSMSIAEATTLQDRLGLRDTHVVWLGQQDYTIAHTDAERESSTPLDQCSLHAWLGENGPPPDLELNCWYLVVPREHDPYSESFRSDARPWDFELLADT